MWDERRDSSRSLMSLAAMGVELRNRRWAKLRQQIGLPLPSKPRPPLIIRRPSPGPCQGIRDRLGQGPKRQTCAQRLGNAAAGHAVAGSVVRQDQGEVGPWLDGVL